MSVDARRADARAASLGVRAYRWFHRRVVAPWLLPRLEERAEVASARRAVLEAPAPAKRAGVRRVWFHGASVGELESLRSVMELALERGTEIVVTHFSPSAAKPVARFRGESRAEAFLFAGYSPWEGEWGAALDRFQPDLFVTAKYEAWPDLWWSLGERDVPLLVVGARARGSLRLIRGLSRACSASLPRLALAAFDESDRQGLSRIFPGATLRVLPDPRWDRVRARASRAHPRVRELGERFARAPRPWVVLGSAWEADIDALGPVLAEREPVTYWLVPHKTDRAHVDAIATRLERLGVSFERTSESAAGESAAGGTDPRVIIVDEMGFLSELYAMADLAYVGGGFGQGVHSTIEPAVHGLAVLAGPKNAHKFPEIGHLRASRQLELGRTPEELRAAFRRLRDQAGARIRAKAPVERFDVAERFGGTARVWEIMDEIVSRIGSW